MNKFYITTTLPYVNAAPHIGFALEIVQADVLARLHRASGDEVFFNTGTDEHGVKIYKNALAAGKTPQVFADENAEHFKRLMSALDIDAHVFVRTTDEHHVLAAQEFWERCDRAGDIEKKVYRTKYCTGCELEKTDSELVDGKCPLHPNLVIEEREEENYFFKFSKYQHALLDLYGRYPDFVAPSHRLTEIRNFVANGLADFSISRLKEKMPWGIPVPGDPEHVMFVWFDALVNYVSTLGWPENEKKFADYWGSRENPRAVQVAGKDNLRQQAAMWQAMLLSAGLPTSRQIFIHGHITSGGQKMSKSLGNVVDPFALIGQYGIDAVRYYLLREIPAAEDGDFSEVKFRERYNGDLANGLGNFAARVTTLASSLVIARTNDGVFDAALMETRKQSERYLSEYKFHEALAAIWTLLAKGDAYVNEKKPWAITEESEKQAVLSPLVALLLSVGLLIAPFLPSTAEKIAGVFVPDGDRLRVKKLEPLFPRK